MARIRVWEIIRGESGWTYAQVLDAENRLISITVTGQTTQFVYDGQGNLVKKIKPDGSRTLYVGGIYEVNKNASGGVTSTVTYYPAAGAVRDSISGLFFNHKDHLGSASVITNASGGEAGQARYFAFGETRFTSGVLNIDKLFTGQREQAGLGIFHYGARFRGVGYSPCQRQWVKVRKSSIKSPPNITWNPTFGRSEGGRTIYLLTTGRAMVGRSYP